MADCRNALRGYSRITALIDSGTSFLEISPLAGYDVYPGEDVPAGGVIAGVGTVQGVSCMLVANDSTYEIGEAVLSD